MMGEKLQAITDAEDGQSQSQHLRVGGGRVRVVHRARASGENEPDGVMGLNLGDRGTAGKDDGEDVLLSYAAGDQLRVLAAKIQDDDRGSFHFLVLQGFRWGARVVMGECCYQLHKDASSRAQSLKIYRVPHGLMARISEGPPRMLSEPMLFGVEIEEVRHLRARQWGFDPSEDSYCALLAY